MRFKAQRRRHGAWWWIETQHARTARTAHHAGRPPCWSLHSAVIIARSGVRRYRGCGNGRNALATAAHFDDGRASRRLPQGGASACCAAPQRSLQAHCCTMTHELRCPVARRLRNPTKRTPPAPFSSVGKLRPVSVELPPMPMYCGRAVERLSPAFNCARAHPAPPDACRLCQWPPPSVALPACHCMRISSRPAARAWPPAPPVRRTTAG